MKTRFVSIVALICVACTQGNKETSLVDSVAVADTMTSTATLVSKEAAESAQATERYPEEDISYLDARYDSCKEAVESLTEIYRVDIVTNQYEASSSVTWYFDTNFNPVYFSLEWSAEGNEGSTELIIADNLVTCARNDEYNTLEKWNIQTGGYRLTYNEDDSDTPPDTTLLYGLYGDSQHEQLEGFLKTLMAVLEDAEMVGPEGTSLILKKEHVVNYGFEFTETTNITISKNLYTHLMGE